MVPALATFAQFLAVGLHGIGTTIRSAAKYTPRVAFLLPAWNEADVLEASIDLLMAIDYPAGAMADLRRRRCQHGSHAGRDAGRRWRNIPARCFICAETREARARRTRSTTGSPTILAENWAEERHDHGRRRALRACHPAAHGSAFRRSGDWRGHRLREGGQPSAPVSCRASSPSNTSPPRRRRGGRRTSWAGSPAWPGRPAAQPRQPDRDRRCHRHQHAGRGHLTTFKTQLAGRRVPVRRQRHRLGRGARQPGGAVEAARALGPGNLQITRPSPTCGSARTGMRCWATSAFGVLWFSIALMPLFMFAGSIGPDRPFLSLAAWRARRSASLRGVTCMTDPFQTLFSFSIDPADARRWPFRRLRLSGPALPGHHGLPPSAGRRSEVRPPGRGPEAGPGRDSGHAW